MNDDSFLDEDREPGSRRPSSRAHHRSGRDAHRPVVVHCAPVERACTPAADLVTGAGTPEGQPATTVREHRTLPGDDHGTVRATFEVG